MSLAVKSEAYSEETRFVRKDNFQRLMFTNAVDLDHQFTHIIVHIVSYQPYKADCIVDKL